MFFEIIKNRIKQGTRTVKDFTNISLPNTYKGLPKINQNADIKIIEQCAKACPTNAIIVRNKSLDLGKCIFCGKCETVEGQDFIKFTNNFKMGTTLRGSLVIDKELENLEKQAKNIFDKVFGRSLNIRQVSAGGCNSCEADINVLGTPVFDLARFGINFVASPRHADAIMITGPVTKNMYEAVIDTYNAIPKPKFVILAGACAISGGIFRDFKEQSNGAADLLPVDLYIPGCPPHPLTTLYALLTYFNSPDKIIFG